MDLSSYSSEIQNLINEVYQCLNSLDKRAFTLLKELEKIAKDTNDSRLLGFAYFNTAGAHFDFNNHDKLFNNIKKAVYELLKINDRELIARSYNLYALEAQRLGCYDVSYQYHLLAMSFSEPDTLIRATVQSNIGDLLTDIREPKKACKQIKSSIKQFGCCDDEFSEIRATLATINLGLHSIYAGDVKTAESAYAKACKKIKKLGLEDQELISRWLLLLEAVLSVGSGDDSRTADLLKKVIDKIVFSPMHPLFMRDVCRYCDLFISGKDLEKANKLIKALDKRGVEKEYSFSEMLILQLKIKYYTAIDDKKKLVECYEKNNKLFSLHNEIKNRTYSESIELRHITYEIANEQKQAMEENARLQVIAETDGLTKIPNRQGLNRVVEEKFANALAKKKSFGIGLIDIDSFKLYNDTYGHDVGDNCLVSVAKTLREIGDSEGIYVARYGGDEFAIIFENVKDEFIRDFENRVRSKLNIGFTLGYFNDVPKENSMPWEYFAKADAALYIKKEEKHGYYKI